MKSQALLEQFGIYFRPAFVSPDMCRKLIENIDLKKSVAAGIYDKDHGTRIDPKTRRVSEVPGAGDEFEWIAGLFEELRGELSRHFETKLDTREGPTFLRYEPGDFFLPHSDSEKLSDTGSRKITAVLYLNAEGQPGVDNGYEGAELSLYGLMSFPGAENHGFSVESAPGLLVAFPSDTRHGVAELIRGKRYCAVCWYRATSNTQE